MQGDARYDVLTYAVLACSRRLVVLVVVASWVYVGAGYQTEGERWLALSAAGRARDHRRIAREELTTTTRSTA